MAKISRMTRKVFILFPILLALSICQAWQLWEQDIFWQIRSGAELLSGDGFPLVDHWSYSAQGQPWMNLQWLSTVILYLIHSSGGVAGLIATRMLVTLAIFLFVVRTVGNRSIAVSAFLLPLVAFAIGFRLQIRSEIFVILLFAILISIWWGGVNSSRAAVYSFFLSLLSAQLHPGVAPFLVVTSIAFLISSQIGLRAKVLWSSGLILTPFLAPYHWRLLKILIDHLFYYKETMIENPDHQAVGIEHFTFSHYGWTGFAWALLTLIGVIQLYRSEKSQRGRWSLLIFGSLLAIGSVLRDRVIPFEILFFIPYIATWVAEIASAMQYEKLRRISIGSFAIEYLVMLPMILMSPPMPLGFTLNRDVFPVATVEFMRRWNVSDAIFQLPAEGDYLLGAWPERKDFIDTREMPFRAQVQSELADVWLAGSAKKFEELFQKYAIHTLLLPLHAPIRLPNGEFVDRIKYLFPVERWAMVAFDRQFMVLVRRLPQHEKLIAENEFKRLLPNFPPDYYLHVLPSVRSAAGDVQYSQEIQRCLSLEPTQPICLSAQSAWVSETQH